MKQLSFFFYDPNPAIYLRDTIEEGENKNERLGFDSGGDDRVLHGETESRESDSSDVYRRQ